MHEASLAAPLLRLVLEETDKQERLRGEKLRVTRVLVRAGLLMGVEAPALQGIFALMAEGSPAEGAELAVETEPMRGRCPDCGQIDREACGKDCEEDCGKDGCEVVTTTRDFHCPRCRGERVSWRGGKELYIASITVRDADGATKP